jgi:hypothetical protein
VSLLPAVPGTVQVLHTKRQAVECVPGSKILAKINIRVCRYDSNIYIYIYTPVYININESDE